MHLMLLLLLPLLPTDIKQNTILCAAATLNVCVLTTLNACKKATLSANIHTHGQTTSQINTTSTCL